MAVFSADFLASAAGGSWADQSRPRGCRGFCIDSRRARPQDCFVALRTGRRDGHDFLEAARAAGANAAIVSGIRSEVPLPQLVVDDPAAAFRSIAKAWRRAFPGTVVGITGSCGKTSTKDLLSLLLGPEVTHKTPENLNNTLGVPLTLTGLDAAKHRFAIVEAGINEPGEMAVLGRMIEPDIGLVTMIGPAHLEKLGSLDGIASEKAELTCNTRLGGCNFFSAQAWKYPVFQDIRHARSAVVAPVDAQVGGSPDQLIQYSTEAGKDGSRLLLGTAANARSFDLPHLSPGMVSNAALALAAACHLGLKAEALQARLDLWQPSENRGTWKRAGDQWFCIDCYNANPASLVDSASGFDARTRDDARLFVIGSMNELGSAAVRLHQEAMRQMPFRADDQVFLIGEHGETMAREVRDQFPLVGRVEAFEATESAAAAVDAFTGSIFLKGSRSYRLEQLVPPKAHPAGHDELASPNVSGS